MTLHIYEELEQGTPEWLQARCGVLTASVIGQLISPKTLKPADNETSRGLLANIVAERITCYVEPFYPNREMERGTFEEPYARDAYAEHMGVEVEQVGFMTDDRFGYTLGYSPDGLVGGDGLIEIKCRRAKKHMTTILSGEVPAENMAQIQAGLLVSQRVWCDYVSFCGGMPLFIKRVPIDPKWQDALQQAAQRFEGNAADALDAFTLATAEMPATERTPWDAFNTDLEI